MNSVSTVIPVHKYNQITKESILSAINQEYTENKVYVIVNSIENDLVERIYKDFGKEIEISKINDLGVSYARNEGVRLSTSEYIAFLDSDDVWYKDKLSKQIKYMTDNKHLICGTLMDYRTANSRLSLIHI